MSHFLSRGKRNEFFQVIATALIIEINWAGVILFPKWGYFSHWSATYHFGVCATIMVDIFASVVYLCGR